MNEYIEKLKNACRKNSLRYTIQREKVFLAVANNKTHPDVRAVYDTVKKDLKDISMDTIYRNLQTLEDLNLIFRVDNQIPMVRFDAEMKEHAHFICSKCGNICDIPIKDNIQIQIDKKIGQIQNINVQIRGICQKCAGKIKFQ